MGRETPGLEPAAATGSLTYYSGAAADRDTTVPSPAAGDTYTASDTGQVWSYLSGSWTPLFGGGTAEPPVAADWTALNAHANSYVNTDADGNIESIGLTSIPAWSNANLTLAKSFTFGTRVLIVAAVDIEMALYPGVQHWRAYNVGFDDGSRSLVFGISGRSGGTYQMAAFAAPTDANQAGDHKALITLDRKVRWIALEDRGTGATDIKAWASDRRTLPDDPLVTAAHWWALVPRPIRARPRERGLTPAATARVARLVPQSSFIRHTSLLRQLNTKDRLLGCYACARGYACVIVTSPP